MQFTAAQIASIVEGEIQGNAEETINHPAKIEEGKQGSICFLMNPKYEEHIYSSDASVVIIDKKIALKSDVKPTLIWVSDAYSSFTKLLQMYEQMKKEQKKPYENHASEWKDKVEMHAFVSIGDQCEFGSDVKLNANVTIGNKVKIGSNTVIYPGVTIYDDCVIGDNCIIHANTVIGSDGFGFAPQSTGDYDKIPQLGNVLIGNSVEIGSNVSIDRATMGSTIIEDGVKLDNLIQIAHNVRIKANTVIAAQTGISGSTTIGENCMIGGQVGFVGHIEIANGSKFQAQSGVAKSIKEPNLAWNDTPAFAYRDAVKAQIIYRKLPSLNNRINQLEKELKRLKSNLDDQISTND